MRSLAGDLDWRPTLVVVDGRKVSVYTGATMAVRLMAGLGPRKAAKIAAMVRREGVVPTQPTRRNLFKGAGLGALVALAGPAAISGAGEGQDGTRVLHGEEARAAIQVARSSAEVIALEERLEQWAYGSSPDGTVAVQGLSGGSLVFLFYRHLDNPVDRAGVLVREVLKDGSHRTFFHEVQADPRSLIDDGRPNSEAMTTLRSWTAERSQVQPAGAQEYMACMIACLVLGPCDRTSTSVKVSRGLAPRWGASSRYAARRGTGVTISVAVSGDEE